MRIKLFTTLICVGMLLSPLAAAAKTIRIELNYLDEYYQGQQVLKLKQAIRRGHPNIRLKNKWLKSVTVIAKSRKSNGNVVLRVANKTTDKVTVYGRAYNFSRSEESTFDRIELKPARHAPGTRWQLLTNGQVKIRKVIVEIERAHISVVKKPVVKGDWKVAGVYKSSKRDYSENTVVINRKVNQLRLRATKRNTVVVKALLEFKDGFVLRLDELEGRLNFNQEKSVSLLGWRDVKQVQLVYKPAYWGKRTFMQLQVFQQR